MFEFNINIEGISMVNCFRSGCDIPAAIASSSSSLKTLNLSSNALSARDILQLCESLSNYAELEELAMSNCNLLDEQIAMLVRSLPLSLQELDLSSNHCRFLGLTALAEFIQTSTLKKLFLIDQNLPPQETLDLSPLVEGLVKSQCLDQLVLSMNRLSGLDKVSLALAQPSSLRYLRLNDCNLSLKDLASFFEKFTAFTRLQELWLSGRQDFTKFPPSLLKHLRGKSPCREIHFHQLFHGKQQIQQILDLNRVNCIYLSHMETISFEAWPLVLERASKSNLVPWMPMTEQGIYARRINVMYLLLRNGVLLQQKGKKLTIG
jgi:hypothetical protein